MQGTAAHVEVLRQLLGDGVPHVRHVLLGVDGQTWVPGASVTELGKPLGNIGE